MHLLLQKCGNTFAEDNKMAGVAGLCGNKANSAQFQVKLLIGAELGN